MENYIRITKGYWIWGLFPTKEKLFLKNLQDEVQKILKSPKFEPHITLSGPFFKIDEYFLNSLKTFSNNNSSFLLNLNGYDYKKEEYESFFISIKNSANLKILRKNLNKLTKTKSDKKYSPHISLSYGNHEKSKKSFLISKLPKLKRGLEMSSLALVKVNEDIKLWNIINTFELGKNNLLKI